MQLYNTLTRTTEEILPADVVAGKRPFGMYVCGPTVQDVPHFGHARAALTPDLLRRLLEHQGIEVLHVRNITDVDDKIINRANTEGRDPAAVAEEFSRIYEEQMVRLGILQPHIVPRAMGHIIEMIELIENLIAKGYGYAVPGRKDAAEGGEDVLFRVRELPQYGALSNRSLDDMEAGARVDVDPRKDDPADFFMWKAAKDGEPSWASPWGRGRPGWHIECSAMVLKYFPDGLDLHAGGSDLIFPHHENEIAQAEASTCRQFARLWMHNGMLNIDGEKMSKSLGNFITLQDAIDSYGGEVVRLYFLQHHYRTTATFTAEILADTQSAWERITTFLSIADDEGTVDQNTVDAVVTALGNDLDTPTAVSTIFETVRDGNAAIKAQDTPAAANAAATVQVMLSLLGLPTSQGNDSATDIAPLVETLLELRKEARQNKDFDTSDRIRDAIAAAGVIVEDSRDGVRWRVGQ